MTLPPPDRPSPDLPASERPSPGPHTRDLPERDLPAKRDEIPPSPRPPAAHTPAKVPHTRISAAWFGVWAGIVVVILLIIFIGQNTAKVRINFLWLDGLIPTALALLIAGVGGAIIATAVAAARIVQLRRLVRRHHD